MPTFLALLAPAHALTYAGASLETQLKEAGVVLEAKVVGVEIEILEGLPLTVYTLEVTRSLFGTVGSGKIELALPGGSSGDLHLSAGSPSLNISEQLLLIGVAVSESRLRLPYFRDSVFRASATGLVLTATDAQGNPLVDLSCAGTAVVARPLSHAPPGAEEDQPPAAEESLSAPDVVFAVDPESLAMSWDGLIDIVESCLLDIAAAQGAALDGAAP